jgi:LPXTG-motif cell wall-anchored protein
MTPAWSPWRRLSAGALVAGVAAALSPVPAGPLPARAGSAGPCAQPQRYAAEANAELFRLNRLDLRPTGRADTPITDVGLATARSAMVAESSTVNSAAAARLLDGTPSGRAAPTGLTRPSYQQAPPSNPHADRAFSGAQTVGPIDVGLGRLTSAARWDAAMACGISSGEVTRAQASIADAAVLTGDAGDALVGVPERLQSLSTTALERRGANVHTVARASATTPTVRLLGDAVRLTVVRAPTLATSISANEGSADVQYAPPVLQVSGPGIATRRLDTPGDVVEVPLTRGERRSESAPGGPGDPLRALLATVRPDALTGLLSGGAADPDLPGLPARPGVPALPGGDPESDGTDDETGGQQLIRVSIGDVRQAAAGHAIAARAVTMSVQLIAGPSAQGPGGVVLDLDLGVLEAAAVAPDPGTAGGAGIRAEPVGAGGGGGLPVTGARTYLTVLAGAALLLAGAAFLWFGLRRRRV